MAELDVKMEDSQPRQRSTNFSMDEDRVLQEAFAKNHDYLTAAQVERKVSPFWKLDN